MSEPGTYVEKSFKRDTNYITTRITADGRDGFPVEAGRYRLVVARACPWANRAIIVRRLLGLEDALSMGICGPTHDSRSWTFDLDPGGLDPVLRIPRIQDAYFRRDPDYPRGITVPAIVDVPTGAVVTNDFKQITVDLETQWRDFHREGAPDLYPTALADEIEAVSEPIYRYVNNGVYRCGFAGTQEAYDKAYRRLWDEPRPARGAAVDAPLPRRRPHHRGRRAPLHDARALRPRLPRPLQVQPQQAHRDAGAVGLRPRPLPDARVRRHGRLRRTSSGTTTSCTPT